MQFLNEKTKVHHCPCQINVQWLLLRYFMCSVKPMTNKHFTACLWANGLIDPFSAAKIDPCAPIPCPFFTPAVRKLIWDSANKNLHRMSHSAHKLTKIQHWRPAYSWVRTPAQSCRSCFGIQWRRGDVLVTKSLRGSRSYTFWSLSTPTALKKPNPGFIHFS